jgi:hypothetical protein
VFGETRGLSRVEQADKQKKTGVAQASV